MAHNADTTPPVNYIQTGESFTDTQGTSTYIYPDPFKTIVSPSGYVFPNSPQIILQPRAVSFTANTLGQTNHDYTTPNYADLINLANYFSDFGFAYTIQEGPLHHFVVTIPFDTITEEDFYESLYDSTTWELVPNEGIKNLLYAGIITDPFSVPNVVGNLQVLPVAVQGAISLAIANNFPQFTLPSGSPATQAAYASCSVQAAQTFQYERAGIEGVPSYTVTLKRTAVIDVNNKVGAFQTTMDQQTAYLQTSGSYNYMLSTPDLITNYSVLESVVPFLPPSYSKIYGIVGVDSFTYTVYAGWVIKPVQAVFIGQNKIQLTQEFLWNEWAEGLYFILSGPQTFPLIYNATTAINAS